VFSSRNKCRHKATLRVPNDPGCRRRHYAVFILKIGAYTYTILIALSNCRALGHSVYCPRFVLYDRGTSQRSSPDRTFSKLSAVSFICIFFYEAITPYYSFTACHTRVQRRPISCFYRGLRGSIYGLVAFAMIKADTCPLSKIVKSRRATTVKVVVGDSASIYTRLYMVAVVKTR
jgi:hypothetical protein